MQVRAITLVSLACLLVVPTSLYLMKSVNCHQNAVQLTRHEGRVYRPKIIMYNRIPKAGSTTMQDLIRRARVKTAYTYLEFGSSLWETDLISVYEAAAKGPVVVAKHVPYTLVSNPLYSTAWIQILRKPSERTVSEFYYKLFGERPATEKAKLHNKYPNITLEKCLRQSLPGKEHPLCLKNLQTRYIAGTEAVSALNDTELLALARYRLEHEFAAFGITEMMEETKVHFARVFPDFFSSFEELLIDPKRVNEEKKLPSARLLRNLEAFNNLDESLYKFAVELFKKRAKA